MIRKASYFIKLILLISVFGCSSDNPDYKVFQGILEKENIDKSKHYIFWNSISCSGCRQYSLRVLTENKLENVIIIVPPQYKASVRNINSDLYFIDENDNFNKKYFGIDNIGLIQLSSGKVSSFNNYNPNEMDKMKEDLLGLK
ncbi:MAG: hypothetical protein AB7D46_05890 [Flavobacteriaceae bacterium]